MSDVKHRLVLKPGRDSSVRARHPWIFSGAAERVESLPDAQDGDLCDVLDGSGAWLARGTLHRSSQILCRILTWRDEAIDEGFFAGRIEAALAARRTHIDPASTDAFRVVNAEGDRLPGLIVDRYAEHIVVQCLTSGMARMEDLWCEALDRALAPAAIIDRSDRSVRDPAMAGRWEALRGEAPAEPVWIREDGLRFRVNVMTGQKTGFYLDQRENRILLGSLAGDREVLNGFAYTGAFGVHAGRAGARHVIQVESSTAALEEARLHWEANGLPLERVEHVHDDIFRYLRNTEREFDAIVVDPPPYAKDRGSVERAARAYKDVNLWAFRRLRPGGLLLSFSCSQHVGIDLFQKILFGAAKDAGASVQWLRRLGPGADHPVHLDHPQGEYLKGFLLRLIERGDVVRGGEGGEG
jgi:23S rRNA (cytosine1962-C5)-methyltransferase